MKIRKEIGLHYERLKEAQGGFLIVVKPKYCTMKNKSQNNQISSDLIVEEHQRKV